MGTVFVLRPPWYYNLSHHNKLLCGERSLSSPKSFMLLLTTLLEVSHLDLLLDYLSESRSLPTIQGPALRKIRDRMRSAHCWGKRPLQRKRTCHMLYPLHRTSRKRT